MVCFEFVLLNVGSVWLFALCFISDMVFSGQNQCCLDFAQSGCSGFYYFEVRRWVFGYDGMSNRDFVLK